MKKTLSIFAFILIAIVGVFVGCTSDRYANLLIGFTVKTESTYSGEIKPTKKEINGEEKDYLEIYYSEPIQILSNVSGMSNINTSINYSASDPEAISITNVYNTEEGTFATITGVKPTEGDAYYVLRIASAETSTKYIEVYVKVVLPVSEITLPTGLALTKIHSLNLSDYLSYHVDELVYGDVKYATNQKEVSYEIISYEAIDGTNLMTAGFVTIDPVTGLLEIGDAAENYAGTLKVKVTSAYNKIGTDEPITYEASINVFEDILLEDVSYVSNQTIFRYPLGEDEVNKTNMNLYSNIDGKHLVSDNGTPGDTSDDIYIEYYNEVVSVRVATTQSVKISLNILNEKDKNIVYVQDGATSIENNALGHLVAENQNFTVRSRGVTGVAKLNIVITYEGTTNPITYTFDETMLEVTSSGVPKDLIVSQDSQDVSPTDILTIYDEYKNSATTSDWGSKFSLRPSTGASAGILDSNKKIQLRIKDFLTDEFAEGNFKLYGYKDSGSIEVLEPEIVYEEDGITVKDKFFLFDLSKAKNDIFFVKALNVSNANSKFIFNTVLENIVQFNNGELINTDELEKTFTYTVQTKYGVKEMIAKDARDNIVDSKHRVSDEYKYLTVKQFDGVDITAGAGSLVNLFANANADVTGLKIEISDDSIVQLVSVPQTAPDFEYDKYNMVSIVAYSVVGISKGNATITITARNGYSVVINVKVVEQPAGLSITIDDAYNNQVITQKENDVLGKLSSVYAKVNGSFNVYTVLEKGASGVISYEYSSSNPTVATINSLGKVTTLSEGSTTISVVATYYKFSLVGDYLEWEKTSDMFEEFDLNVFIPSSNVSLNKYYITVYDSNSLGYEYQDKSIFEVSVLISPITATIYGDDSKISYSFSGNQNETIYQLPGFTNRFQAAFKNPNTQRETIYIIVNVEEFGTNIPLVCVVTVIKAVQIQEIDVNIPDYADKEETVRFLSMYQGESFTMDLSIKPTNPLVPDLVPIFFEYVDGELGNAIDGNNLITIDNNKLIASETSSGYIYLRIFARDSMFSPTDGNTYITILIQVTDGTVDNPYQIKTVRQLQEIALAPSKHYVLGRDINIGSVSNWQPIENFSGTLNGYNVNIKGGTYFTISNLNINAVTTSNVGLFAEITSNIEERTAEGGEIQLVEKTKGAVFNLKLTVGTILINQSIAAGGTEFVNIGTIAGVNKGLIMNCAVEIKNFKVSVFNRKVNLGGIVGSNEGVIYNFANHRGFATKDFVDAGYTSEEHHIDSSSDSVANEFDTYKKIPTRKGSAALVAEESVTTNPVKGTITVTDNGRTAYVGGLVGSNAGLINGIYGIYNYIEQNRDTGISGTANYAVTYQNQGTDALVNVNYGDSSQIGTITNIDSAIGLIAGYSMGKIYNCSADGNIGGLNNIGGIVGKMEKIKDADDAELKNVLASVKINGSKNLGGAVGYADGSEATGTNDGVILELVRVETYQNSLTVTDKTLINGIDFIGGLVGCVKHATIKYAYAVSFVKPETNGYNTYGDIYIRTNSPTNGVGGLIGYADSDSSAVGVYSTLRISVPYAIDGCAVGPLVGINNASISDCYYIGSLNLNNNSKTGLVGSGNNVNAPYYFQAKYDGKEEVNNISDSSITSTSFPKSSNGVKWIANDNWNNVDFGFDVNYTEFNEVTIDGVKHKCPVLVYEPAVGVTRAFIRIVPTSINVGVNVEDDSYDNQEEIDVPGGKEENPNYQTSNMDVNDKFAGYKNNDEKWLLVIEYSSVNEEENVYNIAEVMKATATPNFLNGVNILVSSSDDLTVEITSDGKFILKRTGTVTLTFRAKLNYTAYCEVTVNVINSFDELKIYSDISQTNDLLTSNAVLVDSYEVRKDVSFYPLPAFIDNDVKLNDLTTYSVSYDIEVVSGDAYDPESGEYVGLREVEGTFISNVVGVFKVVPIVKYVGSYLGEDILFSITNSNWVFYISIYEGAEGIILTTNDKSEISGYSIKEVFVQIKSDDINDKVGQITFTDSDGIVYTAHIDEDLNYNFTYDTPAGAIPEDKDHYVPFIMDVTNGVWKDGVINSVITLKVEEEFRSVCEIERFILSVSPASSDSIVATLPINLIPQEVNELKAQHYQYNEIVKGNITESYSFSANPSNAIIPGNVGLFEIDLFPYYAGIESISISSDLDPKTGSKLTFGQLVRVTSTDVDEKNYFILSPRTTFLPDGSGIYLDKYSYIDKGLAKINVEKDDITGISSYKLVDPTNPAKEVSRGDLIYEFDDAYTSTAIGTGNAKLYVQTIAPSILEDASSFNCYITVKYYGVNENSGELELKTRTYTHTLTIETLPQVYLKVKDREANVIAYTNQKPNGTTDLGHDFVEFEASVSNGATVDSLEISDIKNSNGDSKVSVNFSDYATIREGILYLNTTETSKVSVGDIIVVTAQVRTVIEGFESIQKAECEIRVVDVVIKGITVQGLNADDYMYLTVNTSKQLKVKLSAYGTLKAVEGDSAIFGAEQIVSNCVTEGGAILYWKTPLVNGDYVNIDASNVSASLPFYVAKNNFDYEGDYNISNIIVTGKTSSGIASVRFYAPYYYKEGNIVFYNDVDEEELPNTQILECQKDFNIIVKVDSNDDNPTPIYSVSDLYSMKEDGNYILMSDIDIDLHTPITTKVATFDGNNHVITIKAFNYNPNTQQSSGTKSINLGLFDTISEKTIIKNVIVALPNNKTDEARLQLVNYSAINIGAIAAVNNGVIYNCEVITVDAYSNAKDDNGGLIKKNEYKKGNFSYTMNVNTSATVNGVETKANIGLFVGTNAGNITNSRVGRDSVTVVSTYDSTVASTSLLKNVAPVTIMKVEGKANISGFVANNSGTISSSYANNLQIQAVRAGKSKDVKTAGFVVENTGYVYGSYAAGWEEGLEDTEDNFIANTNEYVLNGTNVSASDFSATRKLGGGLFSNGSVAGFVYTNTGYIEDCYSNINVSGNTTFACNKEEILATPDYSVVGNLFVGGFVLDNQETSIIKTSYSNSKTDVSKITHGIFVGLDAVSSVQNNGTVDGCYFLVESIESSTLNYSNQPASPLSDASTVDLGGGDDDLPTADANEFIQASSFATFSFSNYEYNELEGKNSSGVWAIRKYANGSGYPELISANNIATSVRVINVAQTNEEMNVYYYNYVEGYEKGSVNNPQIITSAIEYNNLFTDVINATNLVNENISAKFTDNVRLVKNIDFTNVVLSSTVVEYTSLVDSLSIFDGNYMALTNIILSDESSGNYAFGLFRTLNKVGFKCLTLSIAEVTSSNAITVGGLAGIIVDSDINNINLVASSLTTTVSGVAGRVLGNNFVGGLAGIIVASDPYIPHKVQNVNSNLSVLAGHAEAETTIMTLKSGVIWNKIIPPSQIAGSFSTNNNLRLQYLPTNYYYAGGIAGAVDLKQASLDGSIEIVSDKNFSGIVVGEVVISTPIEANFEASPSIQGQYVGGIAGFIGKETLLEDAAFIVSESEDNSLISYLVAGGIVGQNYGVVSQCYVQYENDTQAEVNETLIEYITGEVNVSWYKKDLYQGSPTYVGGIVGVNIGSSGDTGYIMDCYNRVNVINNKATAIGGIVGASHIGSISNVYTTATVIGDLTKADASIGAVIGKVLTDTETVFCAVTGSQAEYDRLRLKSIVAVNCWDTTEFDNLYNYVYDDDGNMVAKIGALYGANTNEKLVEIEATSNPGIYVQDYILRDYTSPYIVDDAYSISDIEDEDKIALWEGTYSPDLGYNLYAYLYPSGLLQPTFIIDANEYRGLLSTTVTDGVSPLRMTFFSQDHWKREIWSYNDEYILPLLEYGYISDVVRIYTADDFVRELTKATVANKLYVIMNDIDFSGYGGNPALNLQNFQINSFSGMLYGNTISYKVGAETYTRKPILFNLRFSKNNQALFASAVNASFSNFNIVVDEYNVESDSITTDKSAVLAARSTNVNINNVNIYGSLTSTVNGLIEPEREGAIITQGKSSLSGVATSSPQFLKIYYVEHAKELDYERTGSKFVKKTGGIEGFAYADIPFKTTETTIETNTLFFGGFVADGSSVTIAASSFNLSVEADLATNVVTGNNSVYIGSIAGNLSGSILNSGLRSNGFTVLGKSGVDYVATYIGGVVGNIQGRMTNIQVSTDNNLTQFTVGSSTNNLKSSVTGVFAGVVAGNVSTYLTTNNATVGGIETVVAENISLKIYANGKINAGGIAGSNGYAASNIKFMFKQTGSHIDVTSQKGSELYVGGLFGNNSCTSIVQAYTNTSILVTINDKAAEVEESKLHVGGFAGKSVGGLTIHDAVVDGEKIEIKGKSSIVNGVGGIIGYVNDSSNTAVVTLKNAIISPDIIVDAQESLAVGGAVGSIPKLISESVKVLGNIQINASKETDLKYDSANPNKYFFYVGGLAGRCTYEFHQGKDPYSTVVAVTIRNYDVAHQANAQMGAIFGRGPALIASEGDKVYFNEGIALTADYGNNNEIYYGRNVPQSAPIGTVSLASVVSAPFRLTKVDESHERHEKTFLYDDFFAALLNTEFYSKFKNEYLLNWFTVTDFSDQEKIAKAYDEFDYSADFNDGSKLSPIVLKQESIYETTMLGLENNKYYLLASDIMITGTVNLSSAGWVLSCQGYGIYSAYTAAPTDADYYYLYEGTYFYLDKPIFTSITTNSAISGLITYGNFTTSTRMGTIANKNEGVVFACGVKGQIKNSGSGDGAAVGGLIGINYGTVIDCFSMVEIEATGNSTYIGGLVGINGDSNIRGQITNSFFTGSAYVTKTSSQVAGGIAASSEYGFISNSYSIANLMSSNGIVDTSYRSQLYPIASTGSYSYGSAENYRFYKAYYDQNAYIGTNRGIINAEKPYVSGYGYPINTGNLEGSEIIKNLPGHWINSTAKWKTDYYMRSDKYVNHAEEIRLTASWFNHGYAVRDLRNILTSSTNISKLLDFFYTGNGKAKVAGANKTNSFVDKPFIIKHAGLFEIFVLNDNSTLTEKSYYIVNNDLYFDYYVGNTYWAESWDKKSIVFNGDFNGDGFTIYNMYSDYGLFRALGSAANVYDFTMSNCYSQTGLIAGYVSGGDSTKVENIIIKGQQTVYNNNLNDLSPTGNFFRTDEENPFSYKNAAAGVDGTIIVITKPVTKISIGQELKDLKTLGNSAGGLFGVIERGIFTNISFGSDTNLRVWAKEYSGGIVGYIKGGTISDISFNANGQYKVFSSGMGYDGTLNAGGYAGGIAGYACTSTDLLIEGKTASIIIPKNFAIYGGYSIGGVVGYMGNKNIIENKESYNRARIINTVMEGSLLIATNPKLTNTGFDSAANVEAGGLNYKENYVGGIAGKTQSINSSEVKISDSITRTRIDNALLGNRNFLQEENYKLYLGGLVGHLNSGEVVNSSYDGDDTIIIDVSLTNGTIYAGGNIGYLFKGSVYIDNNASTEYANSSKNIFATAVYAYVGGIVGYMENGSVAGYSTGKLLINKATVTTRLVFNSRQYVQEGHAGGIIGYLKADLGPTCDNVTVRFVSNQSSVSQAINGLGGLIGTINSVGTTRELKISDSKVSGGQLGNKIEDFNVVTKTNNDITQYAGGIIGKFVSKKQEANIVENIQSSSSVYGQYAGGIIGYAENVKLNNVSNSGSITGLYSVNISKNIDQYMDNSAFITVGGIVGFAMYVNLVNVKCDNASAGTIVGEGYFRETERGPLSSCGVYVGGLVGFLNTSTITSTTGKVFNEINVTSQHAEAGCGYAGGLIGYVETSKALFVVTGDNSENSGKVTSDYYAGGIIGYVETVTSGVQLRDVTNIGEVSAPINNINETAAGGIVGCVVKNLSIVSVENAGNVSGANMVGGIVGYLQKGLISNVINAKDATITGTQNVGGIVGVNEATINAETGSVINKGVVLGVSANQNAKIGGIVGYNTNSGSVDGKNTTQNIMNQGAVDASYSVTKSDAGGVGGVIGYTEKLTAKYLYNGNKSNNTTNVTTEYKMGTVRTTDDSGNAFSFVGGIIGYAEGKVELNRCVNINGYVFGYTVDGSSKVYAAGGLVGGTAGDVTISDSSAVTNVKLRGIYVGGVVGYVGSTVKVDYITANPVIDTTLVTPYVSGGIVGYVSEEGQARIATTGSVSLASASSIETLAGRNVGGFVGYSASDSAVQIGNTDATTSSKVITIQNYAISGIDNAGGIIGYAKNANIYGAKKLTSGKITNVQEVDTNVQITPDGDEFDYAGGIVGYLENGKISDFANKGIVKSVSRKALAIGGIAGRVGNKDDNNNVQVINCQNLNKVGDGTRVRYAGGVVGHLESGKITTSGVADSFIIQNTAEITISGSSTSESNFVGGIIGYMSSGSSIGDGSAKVKNTGAITNSSVGSNSTFQYAGGIVGGMSTGTVGTSTDYVNNVANVSAGSTGGIAGGIVGGVINQIEDGGVNIYGQSSTSSTVRTVAAHRVVGGVVGEIYSRNAQDIRVLGVNYSTVKMSTSGSIIVYAGGVIGFAASEGGKVILDNASVNNANINIDINNNTSSYSAGGGLVGFGYNLSFTLNDDTTVANTGRVGDTSKGLTNMGGLVGVLVGGSSEVSGKNSGSVQGKSGGKIGGIVGCVVETISTHRSELVTNGSPIKVGSEKTENTGNIIAGTGDYVGGIVGYVNVNSLCLITGSNTKDISSNSGSTASAPSAGGLVGIYKASGVNDTIIKSMGNSGDVTGKNAGGVVGRIESDGETRVTGNLIANSGKVSTANSSANVGGLVGYASLGSSSSLVFHSSAISNRGKVSVSSSSCNVGGIVGYLRAGNIRNVTSGENESSTITVEGNGSSSNVGGIVGYLHPDGCVSSATSYAKVKSSSSSAKVGGIVGNAEGNITGEGLIENRATVTGGQYVGGIAGYLKAASIGLSSKDNIVNYSSVSTTVSSAYVDGVVGYVASGDSDKIVIGKNSASVNSTGGGSYAGGIIGYHNGKQGVYGNSDQTIGSSTVNYSGGIIGYAVNDVTIKGSCEILSNSSILGKTDAGGIIGYASKKVNISSGSAININGTIKTTSAGKTGGVVGYSAGEFTSDASITLSSVTIKTDGTSGTIYIGGIVGKMDKAMTINSPIRIYNTNITSTDYVGGITGQAGKAISITSSIDISGTNIIATDDTSYAGGLFGKLTSTFTPGSSINIGGEIISKKYAGGLVGYLPSGGIIEKTGLAPIYANYILGGKELGGIAGAMAGSTIRNIDMSGSVGIANQIENYGSITGTISSGTIQGCINNSTFNSEGSITNALGGIVGAASGGDIISCTNGSDIALETDDVGGIAGKVSGSATIQGCSNTGNIRGADDVGGLIGEDTASSQVLKPVSSGSLYTGCSNRGTIAGMYAGGLVGRVKSAKTIGTSSVTFTNSGQVDGQQSAGGIIGLAGSIGSEANITIQYCNNGGQISAAGVGDVISAGGMVGRGNAITIEHCINSSSIYANHSKKYTAYAGGMFGKAKSTCDVDSCTSSGSVSAIVLYDLGKFEPYGQYDLHICHIKGTSISTPKYAAFAGGLGGYATGATISNCELTFGATQIYSYGYKRLLVPQNNETSFYPEMKWYDFHGGYLGYCNVGAQSEPAIESGISDYTALKSGLYYSSEAKARCETIINAYSSNNLAKYGGGLSYYTWSSDTMDSNSPNDTIEYAEMIFTVSRAILSTFYWRTNSMNNTNNTRSDMVAGMNL